MPILTHAEVSCQPKLVRRRYHAGLAAEMVTAKKSWNVPGQKAVWKRMRALLESLGALGGIHVQRAAAAQIRWLFQHFHAGARGWNPHAKCRRICYPAPSALRF